MRCCLWRAVAGLLLTFPAALAMAAPVDIARMERAIDLRVSTGQFMGTVQVTQGGRRLLDKGYGLADITRRTPNTPDTKFRLGSITKQFTAAGILLLEERGRLKVEDPVRKYLPDAPSSWEDITIFHLLTHTSGIPNFTDFPEYQGTESVPVTPEQLVARFRDKPLDFAPGMAFQYSNSGYALLGYLIEKVSGLPYARFLHDNLFAPLGMKDSGYDASKAEDIPKHAIGYAPGTGGPQRAGYIDMSIPYAAGALYSTTGDLLRWERALLGGKVLKPVSLAKMTTPFKENYGFGLVIEPGPHGGPLLWHNGGIEGFNTYLGHETADDLTVIVLSNLEGAAAQQIALDLVKVAEGEPGVLISDRVEKPVAAEILQRLAGHYASDDGILYTITRKDGHLLSQGRQLLDLYPESDTAFFIKTMDVQFLFQNDAQGQPASLVIQYPDHKVGATRISDADARQRLEAQAARLSAKQASTGSEEAVRRTLAELAAGMPRYERMGPVLAQATRAQLSRLQPALQGLGAIQSVVFKGPGPGGGEVFTVTFEKGALTVAILLAPDGTVLQETLSPAIP